MNASLCSRVGTQLEWAETVSMLRIYRNRIRISLYPKARRSDRNLGHGRLYGGRPFGGVEELIKRGIFDHEKTAHGWWQSPAVVSSRSTLAVHACDRSDDVRRSRWTWSSGTRSTLGRVRHARPVFLGIGLPFVPSAAGATL